MRLFAGLIVFTGLAIAAELQIGRAVIDETCTVPRLAASPRTEDAAVFVRVPLAVNASRVRVEWIAPDGSLESAAEWQAVPAKACLITQLPVAGFAAGRKPGQWRVRASIDGRMSERTFRLRGDNRAALIRAVEARSGAAHLELSISGGPFGAGAVVHIARFTAAGGWQYLAAELPVKETAAALEVRTRKLEPGEYVAIIRGGDGSISAPSRFVVASGRAYYMPVPSEERWLITQGPHGSFSHWNRSQHAWDIAPQNGRHVVAMRAGVVHTHDLGMRQTPHLRSFGNYITIDHGDGEYSHYAHLATGQFSVRDGERVEAGQRLAVVGNSGYTLPAGGGHHVHVHVTRAPQVYAASIPFEFNRDRPPVATGKPDGPEAQKPLRGNPASVAVAQWWSEVIDLPWGTREFSVEVSCENAGDAADLHLVSPSGKHYGWYGVTQGYSGRDSNPQTIYVKLPEPGYWRISVEGMKSAGGGAVPVRVWRGGKARNGKALTIARASLN